MQRIEQPSIDADRHCLVILLLFEDLMLVSLVPLIHFDIMNVVK